MIEYQGENRRPDRLFQVQAAQVAEQLRGQAGVQIRFVLEQQVEQSRFIFGGGEREQQVRLQFAERFIDQAGGFGDQGVEVELGLERRRQGQAEEGPRLVEVGQEIAHEGLMGVGEEHGGAAAG